MRRKITQDWRHRADAVIAQGALTNSKRPEAYIRGVFPSHLTHGEGCHVYDAWGHRYVDYVGGLGTNILGYGHPKIVEAVAKVLGKGPSLSLPTTLEVEVADKLCQLTGFDRLRFFKSGSESTHAAIRIARAASDNPTVHSEGYHAWHDLFTSMTPPGIGIGDTFNIYPYEKDTPHVEQIYITEPLMLDVSEARKQELGRARQSYDCVIFDEIVTGFRVPNNFVYKWWQVKPDILCLGKGLANGFPLAAVLMDRSYAEPEFFCSGTYCGEMVSLAACNATLDLLATKKVDELYFYANRFMDNLNKILAEIDVRIQGYGTRGFLPLSSLNEALFMQEACKAGYIFGKAFFYGYAHLESGIDEIALQVVGDIVTKIKNGSVRLEGEMPKSTFKRY